MLINYDNEIMLFLTISNIWKKNVLHIFLEWINEILGGFVCFLLVKWRIVHTLTSYQNTHQRRFLSIDHIFASFLRTKPSTIDTYSLSDSPVACALAFIPSRPINHVTAASCCLPYSCPLRDAIMNRAGFNGWWYVRKALKECPSNLRLMV